MHEHPLSSATQKTVDFMDLMFFGVIECSKEVIPYMRKQGWGRTIN